MGNDQDNTMKLGSDWFDVDGLAYGGTNYPPVIEPTHDMLVSEGAQADQELSAADLDGSPVTFGKVDGPGFVTVVTTSSEPSAARGTVRARPGFQDAGRYLVTIRASDESIENRATFHVEVQDVVRAAATVSFVVERSGRVRAHLFDVRGRLRRTLLDRDLPAGEHGLTIDRRDSSGRMLNAGVYFYRIQTPTRTFTGRVPVIKRSHLPEVYLFE
jgi:hypothetical protein